MVAYAAQVPGTLPASRGIAASDRGLARSSEADRPTAMNATVPLTAAATYVATAIS